MRGLIEAGRGDKDRGRRRREGVRNEKGQNGAVWGELPLDDAKARQKAVAGGK